ncbi:cytochrome P450 [Pilatotrama ljubarskyi]|nr:cytochrome P450 [Pilatotrama ljubarskyi]
MAHPVILAALLCLPLLAVYNYVKRRGVRYPPGPAGLPLIGNALDIPSPHEYPWLKYHQMSKEYGTEILRLNALGTNIIMLDTLKPAIELLDKRSSIYSDRPRMIMLNELAGFGWNFGSMTYGAEWRECRKMTHTEFHAGPFKKYRPILLKNTHDLLRRLASGRGTVPMHLKHIVGANIMEIVYDIKVLPEHDPFIELAEAAQECIGRSTTGGHYLVEILPFLKYVPAWFPGAGFKRQAAVWHKAADKQLHVAYDDFQSRLKTGEADYCMARSLLDTWGSENPVAVSQQRAATATMYVGGAETTAAGLHTFFLAMALHPEAQSKAREELDRVVGPCRLPAFDDFGSLPYVDALVKEVLRWYPIVPLLMPHRATADDVYDGYFIDKGSMVMVNIWAILHDENRYANPFDFDPGRFLKDGAINPDVFDPAEVAFGFGRRVCPGLAMAYEGMWIAIASVLACLTIGQAKDADGEVIELYENFISSFVCEPKPFVCDIRPRSEDHLKLFNDQH